MLTHDIIFHEISIILQLANQHGVSDSVSNFTVLSDPGEIKNFSVWDFVVEIFDLKVMYVSLICAGYSQPSVVSIYLINKRKSKK